MDGWATGSLLRLRGPLLWHAVTARRLPFLLQGMSDICGRCVSCTRQCAPATNGLAFSAWVVAHALACSQGRALLFQGRLWLDGNAGQRNLGHRLEQGHPAGCGALPRPRHVS